MPQWWFSYSTERVWQCVLRGSYLHSHALCSVNDKYTSFCCRMGVSLFICERHKHTKAEIVSHLKGRFLKTERWWDGIIPHVNAGNKHNTWHVPQFHIVSCFDWKISPASCLISCYLHKWKWMENVHSHAFPSDSSPEIHSKIYIYLDGNREWETQSSNGQIGFTGNCNCFSLAGDPESRKV